MGAGSFNDGEFTYYDFYDACKDNDEACTYNYQF